MKTLEDTNFLKLASFDHYTETLKSNCSGKKIIFFIPSIDRVCGSDAQEKKIRFFTWLCKEIQDFEK